MSRKLRKPRSLTPDEMYCLIQSDYGMRRTWLVYHAMHVLMWCRRSGRGYPVLSPAIAAYFGFEVSDLAGVEHESQIPRYECGHTRAPGNYLDQFAPSCEGGCCESRLWWFTQRTPTGPLATSTIETFEQACDLQVCLLEGHRALATVEAIFDAARALGFRSVDGRFELPVERDPETLVPDRAELHCTGVSDASLP